MKNNNSLSQFYRIYLPLFFLVGTLLLLLVAQLAEKLASDSVHTRVRSTLAFQAETLRVSMDKYAVMTVLLAKRIDILSALQSSNNGTILPSAEHLTTIVAGMSGANDIWVANTEGIILTSNRQEYKSTSIVDEAYFQSSLQGVLGRDSIIDEENRRFYIFSAPVFFEGRVLGVVVVRVNLEFIELIWALFSDPILATNQDDTVLLSNVEHLRFSQFQSSSPHKNIESLIDTSISTPLHRIVLDESINKRSRDYLVESASIPLLGWNLSVLADYQPVIAQRNNYIVIAFLVLLIVLMALFLWFTRRHRLYEQQRSQQAFSIRLERQVRDRTRELTLANELLEIEVSERKQIEKELRDAQEELIQAAKLAGIGQMSTALAHEYNQPLAALRSYSENTLSYLDLQLIDDAKNNLQRINDLIDRMANITRTLRNVAHKSTLNLEPIQLSKVMDELIILLTPQAEQQHVQLEFIPVDANLVVFSDHSRLSQVLTNLISNAMDAVDSTKEKSVRVHCQKEIDTIVIHVSDTGVGLSQDVKEKLFTPFFTTKKAGKGLGLGLFIVQTITKQLKGRLFVDNHQEKGTTFSISLPLSQSIS